MKKYKIVLKDGKLKSLIASCLVLKLISNFPVVAINNLPSLFLAILFAVLLALCIVEVLQSFEIHENSD